MKNRANLDLESISKRKQQIATNMVVGRSNEVVEKDYNTEGVDL